MRTILRARGLAAALLFSVAGSSCRDTAAPSGPGHLAPATAALAFVSKFPEVGGELVIPIRAARVRLFRLPGETPERAALDTVVSFRETDADLALTLGIVVTMVSERFGLELSLIDDQQQVVYWARDTVVAYTAGEAPPTQGVVLRYVGPDTAVARISVGTDEGVIPIGEPTPLRVLAFKRNGASTSARFGFAVHGTSAITVDASGVARASAPVPAGSAWIVARIATGLADSVAVEAIVPAASVSLEASSGRIDIGERATITAFVSDAAGGPLPGRRPAWSSSDDGVASVVDGVVTGRARGSAVITARSGRVSAAATILVAPAKVFRVVPSAFALEVAAGRSVSVSVRAEDAKGNVLSGRAVTWAIRDGGVASVTPQADGRAVVRGLKLGETILVADVEGAQTTISVLVVYAAGARVTIVPDTLSLVEGDVFTLGALVFDATGALQDGRVVSWKSLDPSIVAVDGTGLARALAGGRVNVIAWVDAVADTISILARRPMTLTITLVGTIRDSRGEIGQFLVSAFDQFGALIDNPSAQWSVTSGATLLNSSGPRADVVLPQGASGRLSAHARGLSADIEVPPAGTLLATPRGTAPKRR
ncbi:MAG: Ig-like domain-containing protein [bacterium]